MAGGLRYQTGRQMPPGMQELYAVQELVKQMSDGLIDTNSAKTRIKEILEKPDTTQPHVAAGSQVEQIATAAAQPRKDTAIRNCDNQTLYGGDRQNGTELTAEMIYRAIRYLGSISIYCPSRPKVYTEWAFAPEEACIEYFKGTGIVVVDRKGNEWLNGEPYKEERHE